MAAALLLAGAAASVDAQAPPAPSWSDPSPHQVRRVPVDRDVELEVLDWGGTGPALVFLAGLGLTGHVYDDFAPRFRDQFHVYAITRRGYGASSNPEGGYDAATRARDVVMVLDSLHVDRAVLAGHSVAADELSEVGASHPARVRALVYLDAYGHDSAGILAMREHPLPRELEPPELTAADSASVAAVGAYLQRRYAIGAPLPVAAVRQMMVFDPDGRLKGAPPGDDRALKIIAGNKPARYKQIAAPVLGIFASPASSPAAMFASRGYARLDSAARAKADRSYAARIAWRKAARDRFRAELAHNTLVELPGASHFVFLTHPDQVDREMRAFLSQVR